LDLVFKIAPISDHVAKFRGDRPTDRGDLALNQRKKQQQNKGSRVALLQRAALTKQRKSSPAVRHLLNHVRHSNIVTVFPGYSRLQVRRLNERYVLTSQVRSAVFMAVCDCVTAQPSCCRVHV